mmetsp:Transcript_34729/g.61119  ORF Transcript_34729/g.61119 Transcript_34729/m.61119 type:complete len:313 (+) Transcript_34729:1340-2278(+)
MDSLNRVMDVSDLEEVLLNEATVLTRNYSHMRNGHAKWLLSSSPPDSLPNIEFADEIGVLVVKITTLEATERYAISSLIQRVSIKKTDHFNAALLELWKLLNPFHLRRISKQLWLSLNTFLYSTFSSQPNSELASACARQDTEIDFQNKLGLTFEDYKHSLFEFLDCTAKSKLANEFTRLLKTLPELVAEQMWFKKSSLHCKLHMKSEPRPYTRMMALPQLTTPKSKSSVFLTEDYSPKATSRHYTADFRIRNLSEKTAVRHPTRSPKIIDLLINRTEVKTRFEGRRKSHENSFTVSTPSNRIQPIRALLLA